MQRVILVLVFSILAVGCKPERPDVNEARAEEAAKRVFSFPQPDQLSRGAGFMKPMDRWVSMS